MAKGPRRFPDPKVSCVEVYSNSQRETCRKVNGAAPWEPSVRGYLGFNFSLPLTQIHPRADRDSPE